MLTAKEKNMDLKNWTVRTRDIETGHEFYAPNDDLAPIVLSGYGKYYRVIGFWAIAGKVSPHWFRHSHATHALDNGADLNLVSQTLGHSDLAITGMYIHVRPGSSSGDYLKVG